MCMNKRKEKSFFKENKEKNITQHDVTHVYEQKKGDQWVRNCLSSKKMINDQWSSVMIIIDLKAGFPLVMILF